MKGGFRSLRLSTRKPTPVHSTGFTIVETMIVLAITGLLFVSFASTVAGRQRKVEFNQAINTVKSQIEQVVNEVQSGYFPSNNFNCTVAFSGGVPNYSFDTAASTAQGTRKPCVFVGKALVFGSALGTDPQRFGVYTLTGLNSAVYETATDLPTSFPRVVNVPTVTDQKRLLNGLTVERMWYGNGNTPVGSVALTTFFDTDGDTALGSQSVQVIPIQNSQITDTEAQAIATINNRITPSYNNGTIRNNPDGVKICFRGGADQRGLITIGGGGGANSVKLETTNTVECR